MEIIDTWRRRWVGYQNRRERDRLLRAVPRVGIHDSDRLYVFSSRGSHYYNDLYLLIADELARRSIPSTFLFSWPAVESRFPVIEHEGRRLSGALRSAGNRCVTDGEPADSGPELHFDPAGETIQVDGYEVFPVISTTLRTLERRYTLDFDDPATLQSARDLARTSGLLYRYFRGLSDFSHATGSTVKLVGWESDYVPNAIFRTLARQVEGSGIEYIDLARGYMHYFGAHFRDTNIAVANLTRSAADNRFAITRTQFDRYGTMEPSAEEMAGVLEDVIDAGAAPASPEKRRVLAEIERTRKSGKGVFVLYAHVFYDAPARDSSPSFPSMTAWIEETVRHLSGTGHLLLIKPHPAEQRPDEPHKEPEETAAKFVRRLDVGDNVIVLDHGLFTMPELAELMSLGLVWRSSVGLELTGLGIPCLIAGTPIYKVLDLHYPTDRDDYFRSLDHHERVRVDERQRLDAVRYIYYSKHFKHHSIASLSYRESLGMYQWDHAPAGAVQENGRDGLRSLVDDLLDD